MKIMVTGGAGFIGSAVVRQAIAGGFEVVNVDSLAYSANLANVAAVDGSAGYRFEKADIADGEAMAAILARHQPDAIMHLAAESHVDRSIDGPIAFVHTNVVGTAVLLEAARRYWSALPGARKAAFRLHHISTDEVFGTLGETGAFDEATPYDPSSPYSATKAGSDMLVRAWGRTYGLPVVISNCSNNYGPFQFPEKLIPVAVLNAIEGRAIPVYGQGLNVRDWLYVEDHADALLTVLAKGALGQTYCIGGDSPAANIDLVRRLCAALDDLRPGGAPHAERIQFVADRPGHDFRYAIDASKIRADLGWRPRTALDEGLARTARWYVDNEAWWRAIRKRGFKGERLGLAAAGQ